MSARGATAALTGDLVLVTALAMTLVSAGCSSDMTSRGTSGLFDMAPAPSAAPKTAAAAPSPKPTPAPKTAAYTPADATTWRHVPEPVSAAQFNQDRASCTQQGNSAPGAGSPEIKFLIVYTKCMRLAGYEQD